MPTPKDLALVCLVAVVTAFFVAGVLRLAGITDTAVFAGVVAAVTASTTTVVLAARRRKADA